jgi:hypothetical protein
MPDPFRPKDHTDPSQHDDEAHWADLPIAVLSQIFDDILRAPTPHPSYVPGKLATWCSLFRTCKHWRAAILETGVGVCLPKEIDARTEAWLKKVIIENSHACEKTQTCCAHGAKCHAPCRNEVAEAIGSRTPCHARRVSASRGFDCGRSLCSQQN